jgi:4-hydroxybenzoate polyprenyltransferase
MNVALPEGQTFQGGSLASRYASFVKLPHTLFALPFAGVGALLASYEYAERINVSMILWILIAFTAARFAAMGFNRIADRHHDARNPRTQMRELPSGKLSVAQAWMAVVFASALFVFASFRLNSLCGWLSPVALAWVFFYSYTKRFTSFAHLVLGLSLGIAPVGAYLAISGRCREQHVVAARDRGPGLRLGLSRSLECAQEPVANLRCEGREGILGHQPKVRGGGLDESDTSATLALP